MGFKDFFKEFLEENKPENRQQDSSKTFKIERKARCVIVMTNLALRPEVAKKILILRS